MGKDVSDEDNKVKFNNTDISYDALSTAVVSGVMPLKVNSGVFLSTDYNSMGYRSEEFIKLDAENADTLFSGCSVTYGEGLFIEETWAYKVWNRLNNRSRFFNLSHVARNISTICFEIIKYCNQYGNPKNIVVMLPDMNRSVKYSLDDKSYVFSMFGKNGTVYKDLSDYKELQLYAFQYYTMLESFCIKNNINLFAFSWDKNTEKFMIDRNAKNFYSIDHDDLSTKILDHQMSLPKNLLKYSINARDKDFGRTGHPGIAVHAAWSDIIFNIVKEAA